ncbi:MAG: polymerase sigma factor protein [Rhizobium sp.]|nr:polymerase sigma factor protein [Rhizobium sp.]
MMNHSSVAPVDAPHQQTQFEQDVLALRPVLTAFAHRFYRSADDIEDLVQETLLKALRNSDKFQPGSALKSWLFTIMRNHFCTEIKMRNREPVTAFDHMELLPASFPNQEWCLYQKEVAQAIKRMPAGQRAALIQISAGVSYEDAASSCGCEVGTIKSRVSRARRQLTVELGDIFQKDVYGACN